MIMANGQETPTTSVNLGVLGAFRAQLDGQWREPPSRQVARVGTVLAGWAGEPVERDRIIAAVWGDNVPATFTNALQVHVSQLRRMVGKRTVRMQGDSYFLDIGPESVDAEQMVEYIHEGARMVRREHFGRAAEYFSQAINLWRGTPYPDIFDPDLIARRAKLIELRDQAREDLVECRLELARDRHELAEVIADARELVSRQPLREKGQVLLIRSLAGADRSGESSAAFELAVRELRDSMGLFPGRELVDVHTRSLNRDENLLPRAMRAIHLVPDHPAPNTSAEDRKEIDALASRVREAVIDLGAKLVTVPESDPDRATLIALAVAQALSVDLLTGTIVVNDADDIDVLSTDIRDNMTLQADHLDAIESLGSLGIIRAAQGGKFTKLATQLANHHPQPVLVTIGTDPIGLPSEVVVTHHSMQLSTVQPLTRSK